ncbi:hypothetical protein GZ77_07225 [Endozoicomonas montiporae]|uniref:Terminase n=2 Tax=Endozoicomonas montiporae TaxID=1027273 RepID=A0A081N6Y8_9GAMM|nr:phage terminase small subunit [Endozoicomonas montiporae]AMO55980.1 small terminase subunit [Endozoicomonas montiporae CL-33]KEQ14211.1 hypothetical protein GZ77_07225 [Endozoicomonas montiporae]
MNIMQQWQAKKRQQPHADQPAAQPATSNLMQATQRSQLLDASLQEDLKRLKEIQSKERKVQVKRDHLLPKYEEFVNQLVKDEKKHLIIAWYMVWLFDCDEIDSALSLVEYCELHSVPMPERIKRKASTFAADEVFAWAEKAFENEQSPNPYFNRLFTRIHSNELDVPDELRAKYYKLAGLIEFEREGDIRLAVDHLEKAFELGALVKTVLGKARKQLDKLELEDLTSETDEQDEQE